ILATGAYERPLMFEGNDLPGVMLASAAIRLAYRDGVTPGKRAVVVTSTDDGYLAALGLKKSGVQVVAVLDERMAPPDHVTEMLTTEGIPLVTRVRVTRVLGSRSARGLVYVSDGRRRRISCDLVAMSGGWQAADELRFQATSHGQIVVEGDRA